MFPSFLRAHAATAAELGDDLEPVAVPAVALLARAHEREREAVLCSDGDALPNADRLRREREAERRQRAWPEVGRGQALVLDVGGRDRAVLDVLPLTVSAYAPAAQRDEERETGDDERGGEGLRKVGTGSGFWGRISFRVCKQRLATHTSTNLGCRRWKEPGATESLVSLSMGDAARAALILGSASVRHNLRRITHLRERWRTRPRHPAEPK